MRVAHSTIFCLLFSFRRGAAFFNKNGRPLDVVTSKLAPVFDFQLFPTEDRRLIIGHLAPHWAVWIAVKVTKKSIENLSFFCLFILFPRKLHGGEARSIFNCLEDERCSRQFGRKKKDVTYRNRTPVGHVANVELRRPKQEIEGQRQEESTQQELNQHQSRAESVVMYHGRQIFPWHCNNNTTLTLNKLHIPRVVKRRLGYRRKVLWLPLVNSLTSERTFNDSLLGAWERRTMAQWGEQ